MPVSLAQSRKAYLKVVLFFCYIPTNSCSITYHKNNVRSPQEHTQSLHYMNISQFFTCLNCIPPTKFASTRARVLFTIHDSFPRESSQCIINFWFSWECHAMVKTSVWSWNKKWVICILSRSSTRKRVPSRHRSCYKSPSEELIKISSVLQNFTNLTGS